MLVKYRLVWSVLLERGHAEVRFATIFIAAPGRTQAFTTEEAM